MNTGTKKNIQWYPRFPGDYIRDTGHLSLVEDGAYNRLLDHYYASSKPLPNDPVALVRICRAFTPEEQAAVQKVADEFFHMGEDGKLHNKRADSEIENQNKRSESARSSAAQRWHGNRNASAMRTHSDGNASTSTSTSTSIDHNQKPQPEEKDTPQPPKGGEVSDAFNRFWNVYPRKVGKKKAWQAFRRAKDKPPIDDLVAEVKIQTGSQEWTKDQGEFIPHPATWLNRGGWEDVLTAREDH